MAHSLHQLVQTALADAESNMKVASAEARITEEPDLDAMLALTSKLAGDEPKFLGNDDDDDDDDDDKEEKKEKKSSFALADRANALADAIDHINIFVSQKLAMGDMASAPGPAITKSEHVSEHAGVPTTPPTAAKELSTTATRGEAGVGLPVNDEGTAHVHSKVAEDLRIQTKIAQCQALVDADRMVEADALYTEIQHEQAKIAADSGNPGEDAKLPKASNDFKLDTDPATQIVVPDNAGMISMTRDQARKKGDALATSYFMEKRKTDPAVQQHVGSHFGLKVSAKEEKVPFAINEKAMGRLNGAVLGVPGAVAGGAGGAAGGKMLANKLKLKGRAGTAAMIAGGAAGALGLGGAGAAAGNAMGKWQARDNKATLDYLREGQKTSTLSTSYFKKA